MLQTIKRLAFGRDPLADPAVLDEVRLFVRIHTDEHYDRLAELRAQLADAVLRLEEAHMRIDWLEDRIG